MPHRLARLSAGPANRRQRSSRVRSEAHRLCRSWERETESVNRDLRCEMGRHVGGVKHGIDLDEVKSNETIAFDDHLQERPRLLIGQASRLYSAGAGRNRWIER